MFVNRYCISTTQTCVCYSGEATLRLFKSNMQGFYIVSTPLGITTSNKILSLCTKFSGVMGKFY